MQTYSKIKLGTNTYKYTDTPLNGIKLVQLSPYFDNRGYFFETYRKEKYDKLIGKNFVQDNFSFSNKNILRGLHYQLPHPQGKLLYLISGAILDVGVDLRKKSSTFGGYTAITLFFEDYTQIWIPEGFAHGFYVLSDYAQVLYKTTDFYSPKDEKTLLWDDKNLKIDWKIGGNDFNFDNKKPILSEKDANGTPFEECEYYDVDDVVDF
jgi:dTDP-4-dehydrorhamnose 3,5-epimerase